MTSAFLPVYATRADLVAYAPADTTADIPADPEATRLLTHASMSIYRATMTALYPTDSTGMPTQPSTIATLNRATCAQALWYLETDDELSIAGLYTSVSIGGVTLVRGGRGDVTTIPGEQLAPMAETELRVGMMLPGSLVQIQTWEQAWP